MTGTRTCRRPSSGPENRRLIKAGGHVVTWVVNSGRAAFARAAHTPPAYAVRHYVGVGSRTRAIGEAQAAIEITPLRPFAEISTSEDKSVGACGPPWSCAQGASNGESAARTASTRFTSVASRSTMAATVSPVR